MPLRFNVANVSPTLSRVVPVRTERKPILGMMTLPISNEVFEICGVPFVFSYTLSHLVTLAFSFGYLDAMCYSRYSLFIFGVAENIILSILKIVDPAFSHAGSSVIIPTVTLLTISTACLGPWLCCALLEYYNCRRRALTAVLLLLAATMILIDASTFYLAAYPKSAYTFYPTNFALLLSLPVGALMHWTTKTSYSMELVYNLFKMSEFMYRRRRGISQGGPKMRGDLLLTLFIIVFFVVGVVAGATLHNCLSRWGPLHSAWSLTPLAALTPLHLWSAGCLPPTGLLQRLKRPCAQAGSEHSAPPEAPAVANTANPLNSTRISQDLRALEGGAGDPIPRPLSARGLSGAQPRQRSSSGIIRVFWMPLAPGAVVHRPDEFDEEEIEEVSAWGGRSSGLGLPPGSSGPAVDPV